MTGATVKPDASPAPGFGPWAPALADVERIARWRSLAALAMIFAGGGHPLLRLCLAAERDATAAEAAWAALESLAPLMKRRMLSAYCALAALAASPRAASVSRGNRTTAGEAA